MAEGPVRFVSADVAARLFDSVEENLDRYLTAGFADEARELGWALETRTASVDPDFAKALLASRDPEAEVANSLHVFRSIRGMTPALARDERVWVRLCHIEALAYAHERWIGETSPVRDIELHFFASGLAQCRDDNALGRLWWNGYLASLIDPTNPEGVLRQMLKRANIRLQFVDRANTSFRLPLARGLIRLLRDEPWLNSHDRAFEDFIRVLDRNGGGRVFEASTDTEIDAFLKKNLPAAQAAHARRHLS
ncbi:DUF6339 family protein [Henriciella mobilis]|jgi:hypothetical protein|uniref:Uncharacterized protein n=1 Tax=Henriciella mobilis TaxID=2305467 RepID=A0A399RFJ2_9PROT|nr:DUF6339 family protein [Henriciella mobilis]RIJ16283.1 hypothetical protein D1231_08825 [Henriciella mobilis]RIJ22651.1 hypothetical protein D1227_07410 [Henriciella mobilis]RIJ29291.1 hypothetical protein D1223_10115 [Henriciella mobilis]|tara:strand:- start:22 stop:774 length:753 start_codon:yes stop_codon:yes gene_type:complete